MLRPITRVARCGALLALYVVADAAAAGAQLDPTALPVRDSHEGLLVAADPYSDPARYKGRFGKKNPFEAGVLAVDVFFRNDSDRAIRVTLSTIQLVVRPPGSERQRLGPLPLEDVVSLILHPEGPEPTSPRRPIPGRKPRIGRGKDWEEVASNLRSVALEADIVPPRATLHGFLFFDLAHHYDWVPFCQLYIPNLEILEDKHPLLFFELDLAKSKKR